MSEIYCIVCDRLVPESLVKRTTYTKSPICAECNELFDETILVGRSPFIIKEGAGEEMYDKDTQLRQAQEDTDNLEQELTDLTDYLHSFVTKRVSLLVQAIQNTGVEAVVGKEFNRLLRAEGHLDLKKEHL